MSATLPSDPASVARTDRDKDLWLIVDRVAMVADDVMSELQREVQRHFSLDPYSTRQRLNGRGYSLLLRGSRDHLAPLLPFLTAASIPARLVEPIATKVHPAKLQGLRQSAEGLYLLGAQRELRIAPDTHLVAILADLSGEVVANGVKQLLVRNAYQGSAASIQQVEEEDLCRAIGRARPVLDLYLLDLQGGVQGAVRVVPGTYDPTGLGDQRTPSAGLNLLALMALASKHAARVTLRTDFGWANLPGCQLDLPLTEENREGNLAALSRFGTLAVQFSRQAGEEGGNEGERGQGEAADPLPPQVTMPSLPQPPESVAGSSDRRWWQQGERLGVVLVLVVLTSLLLGRGESISRFWHKGFETGLVSGILSLILFGYSLSVVRLKRMIENTPVSRIRSLATGIVEVFGQVERCYALVAPVTQTPCIYYRLSRYRRKERNGRWELTSQQSSGLHPFWLKDATGRVLVNPAGGLITPTSFQEGAGSGLGRHFLGRESEPDGDEKWVEESIPEGAQVYVFGFSTPLRNSGVSLHESTSVRLRELKGSRELLERFDRDSDGKISLEEWDEARQVIAGDVARARLAAGQQRKKQEESLVIAAPQRRSHPLIIAQTLNEGVLTHTLWWRALGFFGAGSALAIWSIRQFLSILPATGP